MPNPGENFSSSTGERAGENPRETYERRGEKVLRAMSVEEIMGLPRSELEKFSLEDILAAKAKLEAEYQTRYGTPYEPAEHPAEAPSVEAEPETAPIPAADVAESAPASTAESGASIVDTAIDSTTPTTAGVAAVDIATGAPSYDVPSSSSSSAESNPTPSEVATSEEGTSETVTPEEASARAEEVRRKKNPRFRRFVGRAATAALIALASFGFGTKVFAPAQRNIPTTESTTVQKDDNTKNNTKNNEKAEAEKIGIKDGYGEKGMWLSENKSGPYAFADATEVAEVCDNDECEMIKYTAREESEAFADYLAHLPESMQPEGFKGLTILETESKLESLSDEDYEALQTQFEGTMDKAFTRTVTVNGKQQNAYMRLKNESGAVTHENMELVSCVTDEDNLEVTQFYWTDADGNEIGSMNIKMQPVYDNDGNITSYKLCMQAISSIDSPVYEGLTEVKDPPAKTGSEGTNKTGSEGTNKTGSEGTGSEGTGSEGTGSESTGSEGTEHTPKNEEAEKKNAGDRADKRELDTDVTPKTSEDQDKENFESIEKQKHDDEAKEAKDKETKKEQDKKESEAKEKAEERRQEEAKKEEKKSEPEKKHEEEKKKEADHSAEKAKEQSSSKQEESAKHEEKAREESKAREEKQSEAPKEEPKHEKEAEQKKDDNKEERKNTIEEGDF